MEDFTHTHTHTAAEIVSFTLLFSFILLFASDYSRPNPHEQPQALTKAGYARMCVGVSYQVSYFCVLCGVLNCFPKLKTSLLLCPGVTQASRCCRWLWFVLISFFLFFPPSSSGLFDDARTQTERETEKVKRKSRVRVCLYTKGCPSSIFHVSSMFTRHTSLCLCGCEHHHHHCCCCCRRCCCCDTSPHSNLFRLDDL